MSEDVNDKKFGWRLRSTFIKPEFEILFHQRPLEGNPIPINKIEALFKGGVTNASMDYLMMHVDEFIAGEMTTAARILERDSEGYPKVYYCRHRMTGMSERESLV